MTETKNMKSNLARVNKKELVKKIKTDLLKNHDGEDMTLTSIGHVLDTTVDSIMSYLKQGKEIFWSGMGAFVIQKRKATMRRSPQNGQEIKIPAKEVVKMKLFKSFTDKCMVKSAKRGKKT